MQFRAELRAVPSGHTRYSAGIRNEIINSFIRIEIIDETGEIHDKRLSNGPIESFNRIPKDMKRNSRGYLDFEHARNRILFATRKNATITSPKK